MMNRMYRFMQSLPAKTQKLVSQQMLGALPGRLVAMEAALLFVGVIIRLAQEHDLTYYALILSTASDDQEYSLVQYWNSLLREAQLPEILDIITTGAALHYVAIWFSNGQNL